MLKTPKFFWALILLLLLVSINAYGNFPIDDENDDYLPEPNARVARIKFLEGEGQIKRTDSDKWEKLTLNLPVVEGDEITTDENSRLEIQFDKNNYLRLAENSYLKIVNLQDEGIAVSISQGTLNLTILEFDKNKGYFEVDAPKTTIAVQKEGKYRIDAGDDENKEVSVIVSKWGQARVYSEDSGFVLKNGRSAKLFLEGNYAGEWETSRNSSWGDDFDEWTAERDSIIERNLRNAHYNRYYGDDIYGADDLSDHGEWINTREYGNVWRPYGSTISRYSNWSPYRYGHWRWLPYYGWTWVNDEPWGWATYHHGRWVHTNGYWVWSPYSGYRRSRSFWRPAIVFIATIGDSYCWYPLPYGYGYYDYNRRYRKRWRRNRNRRRNRNGGQTSNPQNNTPTRTIIPAENIARVNRNRTPPFGRVPRTGVVSVPSDEFGRRKGGFRRPPLSVADEILKKRPVVVDSPPLIPDYKDLGGNVSKDIVVPESHRTIKPREVKIGAGDREVGIPMDGKLRRKTVYGDRTPQTRRSDSNGGNGSVETKSRSTGVFDRSVKPETETRRVPESRYPQTETKRSAPTERKRSEPRNSIPPPRTTKRTERRSSPPSRRTHPKRTRRSEPKRSKPPAKRSKPKRESKSAPSKSKSKSNDKKN